VRCARPLQELALEGLPADQALERGDPCLVRLREVGGLRVIVEGTGLVPGDPDADQVAGEVVTRPPT